MFFSIPMWTVLSIKFSFNNFRYLFLSVISSKTKKKQMANTIDRNTVPDKYTPSAVLKNVAHKFFGFNSALRLSHTIPPKKLNLLSSQKITSSNHVSSLPLNSSANVTRFRLFASLINGIFLATRYITSIFF